MEAKTGEIWKVVNPRLIEIKGRYYYETEVRPFLIIDDGRGLIVDENPDYLGTKLTTSNSFHERKLLLKNWQKIGLKKPTYVRIEIPERIEEEQLLEKITEITKEDLVNVYKDVLNIFNIDVIKKLSNYEKKSAITNS